MRTTLLALLALLLTACGRTVSAGEEPAPLRLPSPGQSVVFGPADAPTGGTIVVGYLIETLPSKTLREAMGEAAWQAFLAAEREDAARDVPEEIEEIEEIEVWPASYLEAKRKQLQRVRARLRKHTDVQVIFRDVMPTECAGVPLVVADRLVLHENEREAMRAWRESGGILLFDLPPERAHGGEALVEAICQILPASPLIRRLPEDPLRIESAAWEGDRVRIDFQGDAVETEIRNLDDEVVLPSRALDPWHHRVVATWTKGDLTLRRAWTLEHLVGAPVRRVDAHAEIVAGAAYAPHVWFRNSRTDEPVVGVRERIALERDGVVLAVAEGESSEAGVLGLHLDVPLGVKPGPADLAVGEQRFPVRVRESLRVSVVTDRGLYQATDEVHVRVMVHDGAQGAPVAAREVTLHCGPLEKKVVTSEHGIAAATFRLVQAKLGPRQVEALVGSAKAKVSILVRAFERPTFLVTLEPQSLALRAGERAPVTVRATYANGAPVVGARVDLNGGRRTATTDAQGRAEVRIAASRDVVVTVQDADGRRVKASLRVTVKESEERPPLAVQPLTDLVAGLPGRVRLRGEPGAAVQVATPEGKKSLTLDAQGEADVELTPPDDGGMLQAAYVGADLRWHALDRILAAKDEAVLMPSRRTGRVGESLRLYVRAPDGPLLIEVRRGRVPLRSIGCLVRDGRATLDLPLAPDLAGILTLTIWRPGQKKGRSVPVLVTRNRRLRVEGVVAEDAYRPAETAIVDVSVHDRDGKPTAAVLGYWGVDEAVLALRPWPDGYEDVFDVGPGSFEDLARAVDLDDEARPTGLKALGKIRSGGVSFRIRHDEAVVRAKARRRLVQARVVRDVDELRNAYLKAFGGMPLEEVRTASSFREILAQLLRTGRLDGGLLIDAWRTPFDVQRGLEHWWVDDLIETLSEAYGAPVRSAGPDLRLLTQDDAMAWLAPPTWTELPERLWRLLRHAEGTIDAPFVGPSMNGLIGLGGGAGGAFRGRGGGRDLGRGGGSRASRGSDSAHLREDLDPTLCFVPEAIVGEDGKARLAIPLKDSITTWRLRLVASTADGATGIGETRIKVSQPLHVDPWVATYLTVGDRVALPVAVRNETDETLETTVTLTASDALAIVGEAERVVSVAPQGTGAVTFQLRAASRGTADLRLDVRGGEHADAIRRTVHVRPLGKEHDEILHATLRKDEPWRPKLEALADDVDRDVALRLYASPTASLVGGLEGLLTAPHG